MARISCVRNSPPPKAPVFDSSVTRNRTTDAFAEGGALHLQRHTAAQRCKFMFNSASRGGAVAVPSGNTLVYYSTFETNWATYGGAFRVTGGTLVLVEAQMTRNGFNESGSQANTGGCALSQGGGHIDTSNVTIAQSVASYGGGMDHDGGTAVLTNVTFNDNSAVGSGVIDFSSRKSPNS